MRLSSGSHQQSRQLFLSKGVPFFECFKIGFLAFLEVICWAFFNGLSPAQPALPSSRNIAILLAGRNPVTAIPQTPMNLEGAQWQTWNRCCSPQIRCREHRWEDNSPWHSRVSQVGQENCEHQPQQLTAPVANQLIAPFQSSLARKNKMQSVTSWASSRRKKNHGLNVRAWQVWMWWLKSLMLSHSLSSYNGSLWQEMRKGRRFIFFSPLKSSCKLETNRQDLQYFPSEHINWIMMYPIFVSIMGVAFSNNTFWVCRLESSPLRLPFDRFIFCDALHIVTIIAKSGGSHSIDQVEPAQEHWHYQPLDFKNHTYAPCVLLYDTVNCSYPGILSCFMVLIFCFCINNYHTLKVFYWKGSLSI